MKKRNKKKIADINYLDLIPEKSEALRWHRDIKERVILEVENTGIMNKIAQNLFNKPRFTKVHLDANGSFIWPRSCDSVLYQPWQHRRRCDHGTYDPLPAEILFME